MSFISYSFVLLYLVAMALRWGLPLVFNLRRGNAATVRIVSLLVLSWLFYAWHVPWYILLILASTAVDYFAALGISATDASRRRRRKSILLVSLLTNLGLLGYFKYAGFLLSSFSLVSSGDASIPDILLPIGISFYTFQSMSYTIDVYRNRIQAERSFIRVACYIAFFPQLVAGPIVRASDLLYQFDRRRSFHLKVFMAGAYLVLRGLFLKMVIADNLGVIIDQYWVQAAEPGQGSLALTLLVFFACQLFCDFAGYVDIARGVAYQLGFRLPINFNAPYIATTFSGFWRRWHITLSQWIRDYLYIPLGGNRKGKTRAYVNLLLVMLISGLWHGAAWTYVVWGGMLGLALVIERGLGLDKPRRPLMLVFSWFLVVQLTWIFSMAMFRAAGIEEGWGLMLNALQGLAALPVSGLKYTEGSDLLILGWWFTVPVLLLHLRSLAAERTGPGLQFILERPVYAGAMLASLLVLYNSSQQFIYFQF